METDSEFSPCAASAGIEIASKGILWHFFFLLFRIRLILLGLLWLLVAVHARLILPFSRLVSGIRLIIVRFLTLLAAGFRFSLFVSFFFLSFAVQPDCPPCVEAAKPAGMPNQADPDLIAARASDQATVCFAGLVADTSSTSICMRVQLYHLLTHFNSIFFLRNITHIKQWRQ